jgi:tetratricopeptide (TPR) repeat protein
VEDPTPPVVVSEVAPGPPVEEGPVEFPDDGFAAAMSEALDALKREDYLSARKAFERAKSVRPKSPEAARGLSQVEEGLRNLTIAGHRDRALQHESAESWRKAEVEYDEALALDPSLRFAQEGKSRTASRALLQEKLEYHIGHPERLSDARAHEEASRLLDEARSAEGDSARRRDAIAKLEALVASYAEAVEVAIVSDLMTEVTLQRVGALGKFERKVLEVRPGRYVAVGSRAGFRDVRVEFVVEPGKPAAQVSVRCQEAI